MHHPRPDRTPTDAGCRTASYRTRHGRRVAPRLLDRTAARLLRAGRPLVLTPRRQMRRANAQFFDFLGESADVLIHPDDGAAVGASSTARPGRLRSTPTVSGPVCRQGGPPDRSRRGLRHRFARYGPRRGQRSKSADEQGETSTWDGMGALLGCAGQPAPRRVSARGPLGRLGDIVWPDREINAHSVGAELYRNSICSVSLRKRPAGAPQLGWRRASGSIHAQGGVNHYNPATATYPPDVVAVAAAHRSPPHPPRGRPNNQLHLSSRQHRVCQKGQEMWPDRQLADPIGRCVRSAVPYSAGSLLIFHHGGHR